MHEEGHPLRRGRTQERCRRSPAASIDLIVTDPPFAIDFKAQRLNYNRNGEQRARRLPGDPGGRGPWRVYPTVDCRGLPRALARRKHVYLFRCWSLLCDILEGVDDAGFTTVNHLIRKYQFGVFTKKKYVTSHYHILFVAKDPKRYTFNKIDHYPEKMSGSSTARTWKGRKKTPTKLPSRTGEEDPFRFEQPRDFVSDPFPVPGRSRLLRTSLDGTFLVLR